MGMYHEVTKIADKTWHISELGRTSIYLLEGKDRALLIDTGMGVGDLYAVVRSITKCPLTVVLTHVHPDHAGGIGQFREVSLHAADMVPAMTLTEKMTEGFIRFEFGQLYPVHSLNPRPAFCDIREGMCFELGGRTVQVFETPGHTLGSISLLDDKTGFLFSGDACNHNELLSVPRFWRNLIGPGTAVGSIPENRHSLEKIKGLHCTENYTGHYDEIGQMPADPDTADDLIACCDRVLEGAFQIDSSPDMGTDEQAQRIRVGCAQLTFHPGKIHETWFISAPQFISREE